MRTRGPALRKAAGLAAAALCVARAAAEEGASVHLHAVEHRYASSSNVGQKSQAEPPASAWQSFLELGLLSVAMFIGAFGAGIAPLHASMNHKQLLTVNALGAGLFIGTALAVIIPEGVHSLFEADASYARHAAVSPETTIGMALIAGFLLMLGVDHLLGQHEHGRGGSLDQRESGSADEEQAGLKELTSSEGAIADSHGPGIFRAEGVDEISSQLHKSRRAVKRRAAVTLGLLFHAAADGIALGATKSSATTEGLRRVELVVFIAIMMHKVPAAFALSVYLRGTGLDADAVRRNLAYFALAAPLSALGVFVIMDRNFIGVGTLSPYFVGSAILFSAGTFLYVSMVHALGDLPRNEKGSLGGRQFAVVVIGSLVPLVVAAGHDHET